MYWQANMDIQMRIIVSPVLQAWAGAYCGGLVVNQEGYVVSNHHKARHLPLIIHGLLVGETCQHCVVNMSFCQPYVHMIDTSLGRGAGAIDLPATRDPD